MLLNCSELSFLSFLCFRSIHHPMSCKNISWQNRKFFKTLSSQFKRKFRANMRKLATFLFNRFKSNLIPKQQNSQFSFTEFCAYTYNIQATACSLMRRRNLFNKHSSQRDRKMGHEMKLAEDARMHNGWLTCTIFRNIIQTKRILAAFQRPKAPYQHYSAS